MTLNTKIFVANLVDDLEASGSYHSSRRILINAEILKTARIFAGDIVAVKSLEAGVDNLVRTFLHAKIYISLTEPKTYAIGIAWPSADIAHDCQLECVRDSQR